MACSGSSEFLKKRFGTGYTLTVVQESEEEPDKWSQETLSLVKQHAPSASLGQMDAPKMEIEIPLPEQQHFPELFEHFERNQKALNIASFGLSVNSLEKVFLRVAAMVEQQQDSEKDKREQTAVNERLQEMYEKNIRSGGSIIMGQLAGLYKKKLVYSRRNWIPLFLQIGLPILFVVGTIISNRSSADTSDVYTVDLASVQQPMFVQTDSWHPVSRKLFRLMGGRGGRIGMGEKVQDIVRRQHPAEYLMGASFDVTGVNATNETILYASELYPLSIPTAINSLNNAKFGRRGSGRIVASFGTYESERSRQQREIGNNMLLMLLIIFLVSQYNPNIAEDRASGFAHLQRLMGLHPLVYWLSEVLYTFSFFSVQMVICIVPQLAVGQLEVDEGLLLLAMMLPYFWAIVPSAFVISRFVRSPVLAALVFMTFHILLSAFSLFGVIYVAVHLEIPVNVWKTDLTEMNWLEVLNMVVTILSPTGGLIAVAASPPGDARPKFIAFSSVLFLLSGLFSFGLFMLFQFRRTRLRCFRIWPNGNVPEPIPTAVLDKDKVEMETVIETKELSRCYGPKWAVSRLTMRVKEHDCWGLLGVSGAGKTTTFNILTGQIFASSGSATIEGEDCNKKRLTLGFCPQFDAIHPLFTGREALTLLARLHGYPRAKETVADVLELVGIVELADKQMGLCSGGQKRRLSVAAALLPSPTKSRVKILDEATAGIDPRARRDIWRVLSALRQHATILMSSHGMDECEELCSRIGILKQGGLAAVGTSQSLISAYGNFYVLTMALPSKEKRTECVAAVTERFPGAQLGSDGFSLHLRWQLPRKEQDTWSSLFSTCLQLSRDLDIADFCLTQSSLQDVFLLFAEPPKEDTTMSHSQQQPSQSGISKTVAPTSTTGKATTETGKTATSVTKTTVSKENGEE